MFFHYCWKALLWALFILGICIIPSREIPDVNILNADKGLHVLIYAILGLLTIQGFMKQTVFPSLRCFACSWSFFYGTLYGGLIELLQHFVVPERLGDWYDFLANALGCLLVSLYLAVKYKSL